MKKPHDSWGFLDTTQRKISKELTNNYLLKKTRKSVFIPLSEIVALCQSGLMDGSAKPWFAGSNPAGASNFTLTKDQEKILSSVQRLVCWIQVFVFKKKKSGSAKPWFAGSNPAGASNFTLTKDQEKILSSVQKLVSRIQVFVFDWHLV